MTLHTLIHSSRHPPPHPPLSHPGRPIPLPPPSNPRPPHHHRPRPPPLTALLELSAVSYSADLNNAIQIFQSFDTPTIFSYNTLIRASASSERPNLWIYFSVEMIHGGLTPNKYTYPFVLKSISSICRSSIPGEGIHGHIVMLGLISDPYIHNSLIHFYSSRGGIDESQELFDRSPHRNIICWSSMISRYAQWGRFKEALELFNKLQYEGLEPNESIFVSVICAATHLGALQQGRWIHANIRREGIKLSIKLGSVLINMYCRCGVVEEASEDFGSMVGRNVLTYTALISGMATNGMSERALDAFDEMVKSGVKPDSLTFVGVLTACSHGGLIDEARRHFDDMETVYQLVPDIEHHGCLVDLFGRVILLKQALVLIRSIPMEPDAATWSSLLSACIMHKNLEMGEFVRRCLLDLDPFVNANYVLLANLYSQAGHWAEAVQVIRRMKKSVGKEISRS